MRNLTDEELYNLNNLVEDGVYYLVLNEGDEAEKLFMLKYPSHEQRMIAEQMAQGYYYKLRKNPELRTRKQIEEEFADELQVLRKTIAELRDRQETAQRKYIEDIGANPLPDQKKEEKAFTAEVTKLGKEVVKIGDELDELLTDEGLILARSIEYLVSMERVAVLCGQCWYCKGEDNNWARAWKSVDEYLNDCSAMANRLEKETQLLFFGTGFFGDLPSPSSGGISTLTASQASEASSPEP